MGWEELQCDPMSLCCATAPVAQLAVICQDIFGDLKIGPKDSLESKALLARLSRVLDLYVVL